jgi:hypothetical protein
MVYRDLKPLTDEDGEARELDADDFLWAVRSEDFGGAAGSAAFLIDREAFFTMAEKLGMDREAFLSFAPSKPGFIERATDAMDALVKQVRHAAE